MGDYTLPVPKKLKRYYQYRHLHFITFSCYRRLPLLGSPRRRDALLRILEEVRRRFAGCPSQRNTIKDRKSVV